MKEICVDEGTNIYVSRIVDLCIYIWKCFYVNKIFSTLSPIFVKKKKK